MRSAALRAQQARGHRHALGDPRPAVTPPPARPRAGRRRHANRSSWSPSRLAMAQPGRRPPPICRPPASAGPSGARPPAGGRAPPARAQAHPQHAPRRSSAAAAAAACASPAAAAAASLPTLAPL
eukprot:scaffold1900_cov389-Prasinococcus_capsulatus_cf.AAC.27